MAKELRANTVKAAKSALHRAGKPHLWLLAESLGAPGHQDEAAGLESHLLMTLSLSE